jgi:hypothetical protein
MVRKAIFAVEGPCVCLYPASCMQTQGPSTRELIGKADQEKQWKRWNRTKKEWLISERNPTWEDLAAEWYQEPKRKELAS